MAVDCVMIYNCGLCHKHRKSTIKTHLINLRIFLLLVNESHNNVLYFEEIIQTIFVTRHVQNVKMTIFKIQ